MTIGPIPRDAATADLLADIRHRLDAMRGDQADMRGALVDGLLPRILATQGETRDLLRDMLAALGDMRDLQAETRDLLADIRDGDAG